MSEVLNLFEMLSYKPESISSKTLVEKSGGSLTLYAFDKAQGFGDHSSPVVTVVQIVEGKAEIKVDGHNSLVKDGDVLTIPADTPYSLHAINKVKALVFRLQSSSKTTHEPTGQTD